MFRFSTLRSNISKRVFQQKRSMGGGGHSNAPPQGGIDAIVDKYLPRSEHKAFAVLLFYFTLGFIATRPSKKSSAAPAPVVTSTPSTSDSSEIPSIESPEFGKWLDTPGNLEKLVK